MANKKIKLSKPSKSCAGLNFKVRFKFDNKNGYFIVTNSKGKQIDGKQFNNHDEALVFAKGLNNKTIKHE